MAIINGRRIQVPPAGITGQNLIQQVNPGPGRRPVIQQGLAFRPIQSGYTYKPAELFDKHGNPVKITTIPDRTKGVTYGGERTFLSKQVITEQVYDIAEKLFKRGVSFDEEHADWMIANQYVLPPIWHSIVRTTDLLIVFPTEYPELPPVGFYLNRDSPRSVMTSSSTAVSWWMPVVRISLACADTISRHRKLSVVSARSPRAIASASAMSRAASRPDAAWVISASRAGKAPRLSPTGRSSSALAISQSGGTASSIGGTASSIAMRRTCASAASWLLAACALPSASPAGKPHAPRAASSSPPAWRHARP